mmetsp:Transcript_36637/g.70619  ORF Transcript_36637/g.70619 Transcript_36637/m.70619 type:complete len:467 (-) Transcript_36637:198-1598(-)
MGIRKALSLERDPPIQEVINCGAIPGLVACVRQSQNTAMQFEAAWAITNIASGTSEHTKFIIDSGVVVDLANLVVSAQSNDVREQAIWALGNIAGDRDLYRRLVIDLGVIDPMLVLMFNSAGVSMSMRRNIAWVFSNMCRGSTRDEAQSLGPIWRGAISTLAAVGDEEIKTELAWALAHLTDNLNDFPEPAGDIITSGLLSRLVAYLLACEHMGMCEKAYLRIVANLAAGWDHHSRAVVESNAIPMAVKIYRAEKSSQRNSNIKEILWMCSNILAVNDKKIHTQVIESGFADCVMEVLRAHIQGGTLNALGVYEKEAIYCISNALESAEQENRSKWIERGAIDLLASALDFLCKQGSGSEMAMTILSSLRTAWGDVKAKVGAEVLQRIKESSAVLAKKDASFEKFLKDEDEKKTVKKELKAEEANAGDAMANQSKEEGKTEEAKKEEVKTPEATIEETQTHAAGTT